LNTDDSSAPYLASLLAGQPEVRQIRYSLVPGADIWAEAALYTPAGIEFTARGPGFAIPVRSRLVGAFNVSNCLGAVAATAAALSLPSEAVSRGIETLQGVAGRMERLDLGQDFTAAVDFAHTPNALRRTLETARQLRPSGSAGRVIAIFGSAGLRDIEKRRMMAEVSAQLADITILTAEDPRTESLAAILAMMAEGAKRFGGVEGKNFYRVPDRRDALRLGVRLAQPGDILLACGKGHEQSMAFGTVEYPWDDRVAMRAALAERLGVAGPPMPFLPQP
jgi:UDP-N-acetylmuramoyl-L-alanyl-D-glutamate--2,6-diaminopimelate ligase